MGLQMPQEHARFEFDEAGIVHHNPGIWRAARTGATVAKIQENPTGMRTAQNRARVQDWSVMNRKGGELMKRLMTAAWLCVVALSMTGSATADDQKSLQGMWEIATLIEDGQNVPPETVKKTLLKDGRLKVEGNQITLTTANATKPRKLAFVLNNEVTPNTIDLAGTERAGSRGIYMLNGDTLMICLSGPTAATRPSEFKSRPGSQALLMILTRVGVPTKPSTAVVVKPEPAVALKNLSDADVHKMLIGTWGHQSNSSVDFIALNADGSFSSTRNAKRLFNQMFNPVTRSSGTWKLQNGVVTINVTGSTDPGAPGLLRTYRIRSITATEIVYVDEVGALRREWRTQ